MTGCASPLVAPVSYCVHMFLLQKGDKEPLCQSLRCLHVDRCWPDCFSYVAAHVNLCSTAVLNTCCQCGATVICCIASAGGEVGGGARRRHLGRQVLGQVLRF